MSPTASGARGAIWTCHCWRSEDHADGELGAAGNLRKILDSTREEDPFDLDGDFYSADWPGVSRLIDFLYKRASPAALCLAGVAKLVFELREPSWWLLPDGYAAASSWR